MTRTNTAWYPVSPRETLVRTVVGAATFALQRTLGLSGEAKLGEISLFSKAFHHFRDTLVSETLRSVYFPLPKCACTTFATLFALHDESTRDYDPEAEGVHAYRRRKNALRPGDFRPLVSPEYFKFTVVRSPWSRAVAAYLDKVVKPTRAYARCPQKLPPELVALSRMTFNESLEILRSSSDARLEKHWRSQISFIRGVKLDYLGSFENLDRAFQVIDERLGVDMKTSVVPRVRAAKRTKYQARPTDLSGNYGDVPASELAKLETFPQADAFYDDRTRAIIAARFHEDVELYRAALSASK